ncbi:hypothetical protein ACU4GD_15805 [Cupriavidus basilensis]
MAPAAARPVEQPAALGQWPQRRRRAIALANATIRGTQKKSNIVFSTVACAREESGSSNSLPKSSGEPGF